MPGVIARYLVVLIVLVLAACGGDEVCTTPAYCPKIDAAPRTCAPSGSCAAGPMCGTGCCDTGEHCHNGICLCGMAAACGSGDTCEAAGPIGGDSCGAICCGASGPCPQ